MTIDQYHCGLFSILVILSMYLFLMLRIISAYFLEWLSSKL